METKFVILNEFAGIAKKLKYQDSRWIKINQGSTRDITEKNARDIIDQNFPEFFKKHNLEELKNELESFHRASEEEDAKKREQLGWGYYNDESDFIRDMNRRKRLFSVKASGSITRTNGRTDLLSTLRVLADQYSRQTASKDLCSAKIQDHLNVVVGEMADAKKEELKQKLRFDPKAPDLFDELLDAMRVTEHREIHKRAIKHYLWQIKRKLWGEEPSYHFMLVLFTNKQAFGKTGFLRQFHRPMLEVFANITADRIRDQFGGDVFENYFVACVDELSQLARTDVAQLKEFVTRKDAVQRKMYSQVHQETRQNTTLCGTTNRPINQVVYDPSGMRRWWQINLNAKDYDSMDFEQLDRWEEDEFLMFWRAIDEHNEHGYYGKRLPLYEEMLSYQDVFKAVSPIQQFVEDHGYTNLYAKRDNTHIQKKELDLDHVWEAWGGWCKATRNNPFTLLSFKNGLQELGFEIVEHRRVDKTTGQRNRAHFLVVDQNDEGGAL